jgi:hypothetical protein
LKKISEIGNRVHYLCFFQRPKSNTFGVMDENIIPRFLPRSAGHLAIAEAKIKRSRGAAANVLMTAKSRDYTVVVTDGLLKDVLEGEGERGRGGDGFVPILDDERSDQDSYTHLYSQTLNHKVTRMGRLL